MESQAFLLTFKPCHVDFTLEKHVVYTGSDGALEVAGVTVLSPEQLLGTSEGKLVFVTCFNLEL